MLTVKIAKPCDENGIDLLPHTRPQPPPNPPAAAADAWDPFDPCVEFDFAHYHFIEVQNSAPLIDKALDLWAATIACALVEWFIPGDEPDEDTGMWVVRPEFYGNGRWTLAVVHLDCIARAAHLLPVFGSSFVPDELHFSDSLDVYRAYFVNNNIDHHCHEFLS